MARPREFDMEQALHNAMHVFWEKGYEEASLPDLLKGMSISRGSLYKAFEDKKKLFISSLKKYDEEQVNAAVDILTNTDDEDGFDRIIQFFNMIIDDVERGDRRGCLVCSASASTASYDADIAEMVRLILEKMTDAFFEALDKSVHLKNTSKQEKRKQSELLTLHYVGLRVLARSHMPVIKLHKSIEALEKLFKL